MALDFDVFNGDADGICALLQLRLKEPSNNVLVTGVKRDIALLEKVPATQHSHIVVLDIALEKNRQALDRLLPENRIFYCDHHHCDNIPQHANLTTLINTHAQTCTSLLINGHLHGEFALWAIVGALGDNLDDSARRIAKQQGLNSQQFEQLKQLGQYLNYNAYGRDISDLHFSPSDLYQKLATYTDPFHFIAQQTSLWQNLAHAYQEDLHKAHDIQAYYHDDKVALFILPNEKWARRISGTLANQLVYQFPYRAHAILTEQDDGTLTVSVRAPLQNKQGAAKVCGQFATGGGREAAAGIQSLMIEQIDSLLAALRRQY